MPIHIALATNCVTAAGPVWRMPFVVVKKSL